MRIVSRDKTVSVEFNRVYIIRDEKEILYLSEGNHRRILGTYHSEERAKEVFLDIHNAYSPVAVITTGLTLEQAKPFIGSENIKAPIIQMDMQDAAITTYENIVYYMPEK